MKRVLLIGLIACQKQQDAPTTAPPVHNAGDPVVTNVGKEPRRELRYHLGKGSTRKIQFAMDLDMNAGPIHGPMPELLTTGDLVVDDVAPDGTASIHMTMHDIHAQDRDGAALKADMFQRMLGGLEGFTISAKLSPLGRMSDQQIDAKNLPPQLAQQVSSLKKNLEQVAVPLPREAVGDGAVWTVDQTITDNSLSLKLQTEVTLESSAGDTLVFHSKAKISADDQRMTDPAGMAIEMKNIAGDGTGTGKIDLGSFTIDGTFTSGFHSDVIASGQTLKTEVQMKVAMTPKQDAGFTP